MAIRVRRVLRARRFLGMRKMRSPARDGPASADVARVEAAWVREAVWP
jgi:hypothetical protein